MPSERGFVIEGWLRSFMITIYLSFSALCLQGGVPREGALRWNSEDKQEEKREKTVTKTELSPMSSKRLWSDY